MVSHLMVICQSWCTTRFYPWPTFFFLIYINDLSDDLASTVKLFVGDTSLFFVLRDSNISTNELNNEMQNISEWSYKWKMSFNPDLKKQAHLKKQVISSKNLF